MINNNLKEISETTALILVGGLGTRLRSMISDLPKPMAPVLNKPFLYYKLMHLKRYGIKKIVFCSGYLHNMIKDYFGDGRKFDLEINYSIEKELLGTAGAIKNAEKFINGPFLMMNGDVYSDVDINKFYNWYKIKNTKYLMLLKAVEENYNLGIILTDNNHKIIYFVEKPDENKIKSMNSPFFNAGLYMFSPEILDLIKSNEKVSIEREIFPKLVKAQNLYGMPYDGYFIDIGVPRNYLKFIENIKNNHILI